MRVFILLAICMLAAAMVAAQDYADCTSDPNCLMECGAVGFQKDERGCDICQCQDPICLDVKCSEGKICTVYELTSDRRKIPGCVDPTVPRECQMPLDPGPCRAAKSRWFYDADTQSCQEFVYGGCKGNDNNFQHRTDCDTACDTDKFAVKPGCSPIECRMECAHGKKMTAQGCELCECLEEPTACPESSCFMYCEHGFVQDDQGCDVCECAKCPTIGCFMECAHGYTKDDAGCDTCECVGPGDGDLACLPIACNIECPFGNKKDSMGCPLCECENLGVLGLPDHCPDVACAMFCDTGFVVDDTGCQVCQCAEPVVCDPIDCLMECSIGRKKDSQGCEICQCREAAAECSKIECRMYCPFGKMRDEHGCTVCECQENPCNLVDCPDGKTCIIDSTGQDAMPRCVARQEKNMWCEDSTCPSTCEHGAYTDDYGCETCECRDIDSPAIMWPVIECATNCQFGRLYDEDGGMTCVCREDPCKNHYCDGSVQVCEAHRMEGCDYTCPAYPKCIGFNEVRRVQVQIVFVHEQIDPTVFDEEQFEMLIKNTMIQLLETTEDKIRGVQVTAIPDDVTISVQFHIIRNLDENLIEVYESLKTKIIAHQEETTITLADTQFVPEHHSLSALYSSSEDFYDGEARPYSQDDGNQMVIIIAAAAGAAVLVIVLIAIVAMVAKKRNERHTHTAKKNVIYKKTAQNDQVSHEVYAA